MTFAFYTIINIKQLRKKVTQNLFHKVFTTQFMSMQVNVFFTHFLIAESSVFISVFQQFINFVPPKIFSKGFFPKNKHFKAYFGLNFCLKRVFNA